MTRRFSTESVRAGEERRKPFGAVVTPIYQTSTYSFSDTAEILEYMQRKAANDPNAREEYARYGNPTQAAAERKLAALEGGQRGLLFASGMCAITTSLLTLLSRGDHAVFLCPCYRRTKEFAEQYLPRFGIEATLLSVDELGSLEEAIRDNTRLIFAETPTNPHLRVVDLERLAAMAQRNDLVLAVDSTFATPVNLRPLESGADIVFHSATKYLGGHHDLLSGAVIGSEALLGPIEAARGVLGGIVGPHTAYLLLRGLKTLDLRMKRQNESGEHVARFLDAHPAVQRVYYPGLPSHPDYAVAKRLLVGFGGVVSFEVGESLDDASRFVDALRLPFIGPTFGGVDSIVQQPSLFISLDSSTRRESGIADNLVRLAVGIEDAADLISDLEQALSGLPPCRRRP